MTLRHRNVTKMHLFIEDLYNKAQKVAFYSIPKETFQYLYALFCWQFYEKLLAQYFRCSSLANLE